MLVEIVELYRGRTSYVCSPLKRLSGEQNRITGESEDHGFV